VRQKREILGQMSPPLATERIADFSDKLRVSVAADVKQWRVRPNGTEGHRTAEVTRGGVDASGLSSKTFESRSVPGLYFIGEVVDVTGPYTSRDA
jgi:predicted flavoprotein YhiN